MDILERRSLLTGIPNPNSNLDYVTGFEGQINAATNQTPTLVFVRYVPDRLILVPKEFDLYLCAVEQVNWNTLEDIAVTVLDDVRNELVTRWVQVEVKSAPTDLPHLHRRTISLQDRQPNWENDDLLAQLSLI